MKKVKLSCLLLLLILSIFAGVGVELIRAEIVDTNDEENPISTNVQENSFIWNNRIFVFYCNGTYMVYKSRSNFTSWSSEIAIRANTDGEYFSVWLEEDGATGYVHYAATAYSMSNKNIYYRRGQLLSDGTISWSASEQTILWFTIALTGYMLEPFIATDSEGYPIIISCFYHPPDGGAYWNTTIRRSSTKDGTWNTDWERSWLYQVVPSWSNVFYVNRIVPMTSRKFMVFTVRGNAAGRTYYWDGSYWNFTDGGVGEHDTYSMIGLNSLYNWKAVAEVGNDVVHVVYNKLSGGDYFFQHRKWNSTGWWYEHPNQAGDDSYYWSTNVRPQLTLNSSDNTMRATWLEYNGTSFLNNTVWYRDWDGSSWGTPAVWTTETDDIIEYEDFTSIYSSDMYWAVCYITNATSKNVEVLYTPPLFGPPTGEYYDVEIYIRINGYDPYTNVTFTIDSTTYSNGQTASLFSDVYGDYHNLTGTSLTHLSFINWTVTGDVTVSSASDPAAHLFVSGTGTLTEHLNATVAIAHNETTITNFNADDWLFAEHKYYDFNTTFVLTNSYIDTVMWSFLDHASNNVTFYFTNSSIEGVLAASEPFALTGQNATYSYTWINLTDQYFTVTISLWLKYNIIDTLEVDLYVFGNCSGYGMTNSTALWVTAQTDYMNLYSQGGAEEMTTSGQAGRVAGGDFFNMYCYNNSYALSEIYWRHLVHTKVLFEIKWDHGEYGGLPWEPPSQDFPNNFHVQVGFEYYARGAWCVNNKVYVDLKLLSFGWGANHQFSKWQMQVVMGGSTVYQNDVYGWFDDEADSYKVWIDVWFNKANASSISGMRVSSYWYAVYNSADWLHRVFTGNDWGVYYENQSAYIVFGMLEAEGYPAPRLFSSEIELVKLWCQVRQDASPYNYSCQVWQIHQFDMTFNPQMQGILTPTFETPKTPNMPVGGFLGVLASWLSALLGIIAPAFSYAWTGLVWLFDEVLSYIPGVGEGAFSNFLTMVVAVSGSIFSFMVSLATGFVDFATAIGYTISWFFTNLFGSVWGILNFLLLTPTFNVFSAFATIVGVALAWLGGTTYTNAWGQVYDFSYLSSMTIPGTGFSGGITVFYMIFVCGFFIQILACVGTMSIEPIAQPIRLFWGIILFMIQVIEILWNITTGFIGLLVKIVHALRDIAPRPLGI